LYTITWFRFFCYITMIMTRDIFKDNINNLVGGFPREYEENLRKTKLVG